MARLANLIRVLPTARWLGEPSDPEIAGVAYDSRRVKPGDLFVCIRGFRTDGHRYLADAVARGAVATVVETPVADAPVPRIAVPDAREAIARLATAFFGHPSARLRLIGVTGTNGKTTTTYLIESLFRAAGQRTGVIGTIGCCIAGERLPAEHTTPEAPDLQALLARMVAAGVSVVSMEASSHALALHRTLGCEFDVGVFTNLTQDHLDFHASLEDYFAAKARLFTDYPARSGKPFVGVINGDDPFGRRLVELCRGRVVTYAVEQPADLQAVDIEARPQGLRFTVVAAGERYPVRLRLGGRFNVYNSLAAIGAARALGLDWETILAGLATAPGVPGRFEAVDEGQPFAVLVDYAHTPDGLENVLRSARDLEPRQLIVVFGCGGDRDRTKRPKMGRIAAERADRVVVTSDNPRTEDPEAILAEIVAGIPPEVRSRVRVIPDRREAIRTAIGMAGAGDLVVIAGKGHEDYQIVGTTKHPFDDREEARAALRALTVAAN